MFKVKNTFAPLYAFRYAGDAYILVWNAVLKKLKSLYVEMDCISFKLNSNSHCENTVVLMRFIATLNEDVLVEKVCRYNRHQIEMLALKAEVNK